MYAPDAKACDNDIFSLGVPILGICYGMQYIARCSAGRSPLQTSVNTGITKIQFNGHPLFNGLGDVVWMNHNDSVTRAPEGFAAIAKTEACPVAGFASEEKKLYGIQFHAEVTHTVNGQLLFRNFLRDVCGLKCDYSAANLREELIAQVRAQVGNARVIGALSGGVDSSLRPYSCTRRLASSSPASLWITGCSVKTKRKTSCAFTTIRFRSTS